MNYILLDPHVHIYPEYDLTIFLDSLFNNFTSYKLNNVINFAIILTEKNNFNYYQELSKLKIFGKYNFTEFSDYLRVSRDGVVNLLIFPGRQINTKEGLEVLGLFLKSTLTEKESLTQTINEIKSLGGLAVINWAPGKWLGKRGQILEEILPEISSDVALGYTALLPRELKFPALISRQINLNGVVLCGSDPLPMKNEENIVGSTGVIIERDDLDIVLNIKNYIFKKKNLNTFGKRNSIVQSIFRILKYEIKRKLK